MIKYRLLALFALLLVAGEAFGQDVEAPVDENAFPHNVFPKKAPSHLSVGLFGGFDNNHHVIDVAYATDMKYTDLSGFTAGLALGYHPTGWFALRDDVAMVQKNDRLDRDNRYLPFVYTESTNNYLSVPVVAELSIGRTFRVVGIIGGYAGYWLSGHREGQSLSVTYLVTNNQEDTFFDEDYQFNDTRDNRFDAGLVYGFSARCTIVKKIDLSAEIRWYYGLTDIHKKYMSNLNPRYNTTRAIQFGIAYWL